MYSLKWRNFQIGKDLDPMRYTLISCFKRRNSRTPKWSRIWWFYSWLGSDRLKYEELAMKDSVRGNEVWNYWLNYMTLFTLEISDKKLLRENISVPPWIDLLHCEREQCHKDSLIDKMILNYCKNHPSNLQMILIDFASFIDLGWIPEIRYSRQIIIRHKNRMSYLEGNDYQQKSTEMMINNDWQYRLFENNINKDKNEGKGDRKLNKVGELMHLGTLDAKNIGRGFKRMVTVRKHVLIMC